MIRNSNRRPTPGYSSRRSSRKKRKRTQPWYSMFFSTKKKRKPGTEQPPWWAKLLPAKKPKPTSKRTVVTDDNLAGLSEESAQSEEAKQKAAELAKKLKRKRLIQNIITTLMVLVTLVVIAIAITLIYWAGFILPEDRKTIRNGLPRQNIAAGVYAAKEGDKPPELLAGREVGSDKSVKAFRLVEFHVDAEVKKDSPGNWVPAHVAYAIFIREDRAFYDHVGVDVWSVMRAVDANYEAGESVQGASTIDQQIIKNLLLTPEKRYRRKIREGLLALALEIEIPDKDAIFTYYLNIAYFGQYGGMEIRGIGQAAWVYFGCEVRDLSLRQAAILAQMIQSPGRYAPWTKNAQVVLARSNETITDMMSFNDESRKVLMQLKKKSRISQQATKVLASTSLETKEQRNVNDDAPYAVDAVYSRVRQDHENLSAAEAGSLHIQSTISKTLQDAATQAVQDWMATVDTRVRKGVTPNVALVALNPHNGDVLALVGGRDYVANQFNRATNAKRQPGSVFKPFLWAAAMHKDADKFNWARRIRESKPASGWPGSLHGYCECDLFLPDALKISSNDVAVKIGDELGISTVQEFIQATGMPKPRADRASFIGNSEVTPLQIAGAAAMFVTGKPVTPVLYREATGPGVSKLEPKTTDYGQVLSSEEAFIMTKMMQRIFEEGGTGASAGVLGLTHMAAGKTGSSRDAWFLGYTPNLVVVVYIGADDNKDIGATGAKVALPIWVDFLQKALAARPDLGGDFPDIVPGVVKAPYTTDVNGNPVYGYFLEGKQPKFVLPAETPTPTPEPTPVEGEPTPTPTPTATPTATPTPLGSRPRTVGPSSTPTPSPTPEGQPPPERNG